MIIFSKRDPERRTGRADSRKSTRNRLFWMGTSESPRLEPRTMPALTVTTFQIPLVALVEPQGITAGPEGNLWFTENGAGKIGRMTPAGVVTSFALPAVPPPAGSPAGTAGTTPNPTAITAGPDGALWFTGIPGEIGRITTAGVVTEFALPAVPPPAGSKPGTAGTLATASAIVAGPDGALWFTGVPGEIGRISTTGVVTEFAVPDIPPAPGSVAGTAGTLATLNAITAGPDGALWFTGVPGEIGRVTTTGVVTEFAVPAIPPSAGSSPGTPGTPATAEDIAAGPDGALWFTGVQGEVGRITTAGVVTEFAAASAGTGSAIATGPDGSLWFTVPNGNGVYASVARITPPGVVSSFNLPGNFHSIGGLTPGPGGNLWFTEQEDGQTNGQQPAIGEITPAGTITLHAIPQGTTLDPSLGVPVNPQTVTAGPDGALWFGETGAIGRITTTGSIEQFPLPTPTAFIGNIAAGPDGDIWFTEELTDPTTDDVTDSIGRMSASGVITVYPLPLSNSAYVTAGPDGDIWFTENLIEPTRGSSNSVIGRITPAGQIQTFPLPAIFAKNAWLGNITLGPDGNLWFPAGVGTKAAIGRITATGKIKMYGIPSTGSEGSYHAIDANPPTNIISGPDGKLWYQSTVDGIHGIARISTKGKLGPFIPLGRLVNGLAFSDEGQVWYVNGTYESNGLGVATRSGILATEDLPAGISLNGVPYSGTAYGLTFGSDGNLWATSGSSIVRISGLDTVAGGLDDRHRPKRAPDFTTYGYDLFAWSNVTASAQPTFAGVARPGGEVTLWAQKQGDSQPVLIGQTAASGTDGSWTLKSHVKLSNGYYAVAATQSGDAGPPSVLYSLEPDSSGSLSNALVIQSPHGNKGKA